MLPVFFCSCAKSNLFMSKGEIKDNLHSYRLWWVREFPPILSGKTVALCSDLLERLHGEEHSCNTGNQNPPHRAASDTSAISYLINQTERLRRLKNTPGFCWHQEGPIGYAWMCFVSWTVAVLRVRGLPSFLTASCCFQAAQGWTSCFGSWDSLKTYSERAPWRVVRISLG